MCLNSAVWEDVFINLKPDPLSPPMNPKPQPQQPHGIIFYPPSQRPAITLAIRK
jgi:hypothetical protein